MITSIGSYKYVLRMGFDEATKTIIHFYSYDVIQFFNLESNPEYVCKKTNADVLIVESGAAGGPLATNLLLAGFTVVV
jgi:hypothetical protein